MRPFAGFGAGGTGRMAVAWFSSLGLCLGFSRAEFPSSHQATFHEICILGIKLKKAKVQFRLESVKPKCDRADGLLCQKD